MTNEIMSDVIGVNKQGQEIYILSRRNNLTSIFVLAFLVTWHNNNKRPTLSRKSVTTRKNQLYELYDKTYKETFTKFKKFQAKLERSTVTPT